MPWGWAWGCILMGPSNLRDPPLYYDRSIFYTSLTRELTKETFARMGVSTFFIILLLEPFVYVTLPF